MTYAETHEAGKLTVKGKSYDIFVTDAGTWVSYPGGEKVEAASRDALGKAIDKHVRKAVAKIAVPFVKFYNGMARRGVATGLHSRSSNLLVRWDDNGQAEQIPSWSNYGNFYTGPLTDEQLKWYADKNAERAALNREIERFTKEHEIKLPKLVREALDAAVSGEES